MLTNKQKKFLKKEAHHLKPIFQIGKSGLHDTIIKELNAALDARELIKIQLLQNTGEVAEDAGVRIARDTEAELVQVIGHTLILYKPSKEHKRIELPKE